MTSKIINMGDHKMDNQDRALQDLFAHEPLADDGFGRGVMRRLKRETLLRRLLVPGAAIIGAVFAFVPATNLLSVLSPGLQQVLARLASADMPLIGLSSSVTMSLGLFVVALVSMQLLED